MGEGPCVSEPLGLRIEVGSRWRSDVAQLYDVARQRAPSLPYCVRGQ